MNFKELAKLFKEDGKPLKLTTTQAKVFEEIVTKKYPRNIYLLPTRYGKSMIVALAVIVRLCLFNERWAIVAPTQKQARIIMKKIQTHIGDSPLFQSQTTTDYDKLDKEKSRERLTFRKGGEVFILSADQSNKQRAGDSVMGFGAPNLICDESSLIDDDIFAKIFRMLGDKLDSFFVELGNPFRRNHFKKHFESSSYNKIKLTAEEAVKEGRYSKEFIKEQEGTPFFDVLYNCEFPSEESLLDDKWYPLLTSSQVKDSFVPNFISGSKLSVGMDVATGGQDATSWVKRSENCAEIICSTHSDDPEFLVGKSLEIINDLSVWDRNFFIDATTAGKPIYSLLKKNGENVRGAIFAERANDEKRFRNKRAEWYWKLRQWIKDGGKLVESDKWLELADIYYKPDAQGRIQIMSKDLMRGKGFGSPDFADGLAMTFDVVLRKKPDKPTTIQERIKELQYKKELKVDNYI